MASNCMLGLPSFAEGVLPADGRGDDGVILIFVVCTLFDYRRQMSAAEAAEIHCS